MKHGDKALTRLRVRQEATPNKAGYTKPGSMKKSQSLVKGAVAYSHGTARAYEPRTKAQAQPAKHTKRYALDKDGRLVPRKVAA